MARTPPPMWVTLPDREEASGMADMFAEYLEANLRDFPRKRWWARGLKLPVVLWAADRSIGITLRFAGGVISVENGALDGAAARFEGPFFLLTKLASAQAISLKDLREVRVEGAWARPLMALRTVVLLRTPASLYKDS